jgi:hypothetical protein
MPTIAEMLVASGLESSQKGPDLSGSLVKGGQLAEHINNIQDKRAHLEKAKAEQESEKWKTFGTWLDTYSKMPEGPAKKAYGSNFIPTGISAIGLSDKVHPEIIKMSTSDQQFAAFLHSKVRSGDLRVADLNDPNKAASLWAKEGQQFGDAQKMKDTIIDNKEALLKAEGDSMASDEKDSRARMMATAALTKQVQGQNEAGNIEVRKKVGDRYTVWETGGGKAASDKSAEAFRDAIKQLESNDVVLGTWDKNVPWGGEENVLARLDPKAKALIDQVRGGVNMKERLADPNPTAQQISSTMSRVIDPRLNNEENIKKLKAELKIIEASGKSSVNEFRAHNFIKDAPKEGAKKLPDFIGARKDAYKKLSAAEKKKFVDGAAKKYDVKHGDIMKLLGE